MLARYVNASYLCRAIQNTETMNSNETWLPVVGYENYYEVSNLGRVRSLGHKARVLRPAKNRKGYLCVALCRDGKLHTYKVHRLVCAAFHENPLNLPQVNHKNEVKTDNRAENLEWCDNRYNCTYGSLVDKIAKESREVFQYTTGGEFVAWYPSANEAARCTGMLVGGIAGCANQKYKTYAGFQWSYVPALFLDETEGRLNNSRSKRIYQYDAHTGVFIREWLSAAEVHRQTGWSQGNIADCARGKYQQTHGYRWFYEYQGLKIKVDA